MSWSKGTLTLFGKKVHIISKEVENDLLGYGTAFASMNADGDLKHIPASEVYKLAQEQGVCPRCSSKDFREKMGGNVCNVCNWFMKRMNKP